MKKIVAYLLVLLLVLQSATLEVQAAGTLKVTNVSNDAIYMAKGSSFTLKTNVSKKKLKFTTSKKKVATVSSDGVITAKKKGKAVITIKNIDTGAKKKISVKVGKPKGYTINKTSGTYQAGMKVKIKAKKGYKVYYSTNGKFKKNQVVKSGKKKIFTFDKNTELTIFVFKNTEKITSAKKKQRKMVYTYSINENTEKTETSTEVATTETSSTETTTPEQPPEQPPTPPTDDNPPAPPTDNKDEEEQPTDEEEKPTIGSTEEDSTTEEETTEDIVEPTETSGVATDENGNIVIDEDGQINVEIGDAPTKKLTYTIADDTGEEQTVLEISKNNKVTISKGGIYYFTESGNSLLTGRIEVKTKAEDVTIVLAGVHLTSDEVDGVVTVKKESGNVTIVLEGDTVNELVDTAVEEYETDEATGETDTTYPDGALVSKKTPLTISGTGSLVVSSTYGTGVKSTGSLAISGSNITVKSAGNNGISAKETLTVTGSTLNICSDGDGIKTTTPENEDDETLGNMTLTNSTIQIDCSEDGIQCYRNAVITNCSITVEALQEAGKLYTVEGEEKDSFKGIKAGGDLTIDGGVIDVTSSDDALHANGSIFILNNPEITLACGDDGMHADYALDIASGDIEIVQSYEGLEAADIIIRDGDIDVTSSDDGMNAGGGSDDTETEGGFGQDNFRPGGSGNSGDSSNSSYSITISGGTLEINAGGDGIDSNGNVYITGGTIYVSGPTDGGNGALDYAGSFDISGGTLVAVGSVGMDETPSTTSTQPSLRVQLSSVQSAGTVISLQDADGQALVTYTPQKQFQSIVISDDDMVLQGTYYLYVNGTLNQTVTLTSTVTGGASGGMTPGGR